MKGQNESIRSATHPRWTDGSEGGSGRPGWGDAGANQFREATQVLKKTKFAVSDQAVAKAHETLREIQDLFQNRARELKAMLGLKKSEPMALGDFRRLFDADPDNNAHASLAGNAVLTLLINLEESGRWYSAAWARRFGQHAFGVCEDCDRRSERPVGKRVA